MSKNLGGIDRVLRIVVGLAMIGAAVFHLLPIWGWIGVPSCNGSDRMVPGLSAIRLKTRIRQDNRPYMPCQDREQTG